MIRKKKHSELMTMYHTLDKLDDSIQSEFDRVGKHEATSTISQLLRVIELKIEIISKLDNV